MSKKDYEKRAKILRHGREGYFAFMKFGDSIGRPVCNDKLVDMIATMLKEDNPAFSRAKFKHAVYVA